MIHIRQVTREEFVQGILRKMAPPLGSLHFLSLMINTFLYIHTFLLSHTGLFCTRSTVGSSPKHQLDFAETTRRPLERNARLLLQVQRSAICQS